MTYIWCEEEVDEKETANRVSQGSRRAGREATSALGGIRACDGVWDQAALGWPALSKGLAFGHSPVLASGSVLLAGHLQGLCSQMDGRRAGEKGGTQWAPKGSWLCHFFKCRQYPVLTSFSEMCPQNYPANPSVLPRMTDKQVCGLSIWWIIIQP